MGYGGPANTVSSRIEIVLSYVLIIDFERLAKHPLPDNELKTLLKLFAAIRYMFTNKMSDTRLNTLEKLIQDFTNLNFKLHPEVAQAAANFHIFKHIPDDIRRFGPIYGYWLFPTRASHQTTQSINTNGPLQNQEQVEQMRLIPVTVSFRPWGGGRTRVEGKVIYKIESSPLVSFFLFRYPSMEVRE